MKYSPNITFLYNAVYKSFLGRDLTQNIYFGIENFLHFNLIIVLSSIIFLLSNIILFCDILVSFKPICDNSNIWLLINSAFLDGKFFNVNVAKFIF